MKIDDFLAHLDSHLSPRWADVGEATPGTQIVLDESLRTLVGKRRFGPRVTQTLTSAFGPGKPAHLRMDQADGICRVWAHTAADVGPPLLIDAWTFPLEMHGVNYEPSSANWVTSTLRLSARARAQVGSELARITKGQLVFFRLQLRVWCKDGFHRAYFRNPETDGAREEDWLLFDAWLQKTPDAPAEKTPIVSAQVRDWSFDGTIRASVEQLGFTP